MSQYIHISKFSTLNFEPENQKFFEDKVNYCQKVHVNDPILIQFGADATQTFSYNIENSIGTIVRTGTFSIMPIDSQTSIFEVEITGLSQDIYTFKIYQTTTGNILIAQSSIFCITTDVDDTILLTYTNSINDYDTVFINYTERVFNFRVEGGFINSGNKYMLENDSFRNQFQQIRQLYQVPYKTKELIIGGQYGVPDWIAEKINFIFCCSNVYINGLSHSRSEKEVPTRIIISEGYPFCNFKLIVEGGEEIYTMGVPIFSSDWIASNGLISPFGTWINNGMDTNVYPNISSVY